MNMKRLLLLLALSTEALNAAHASPLPVPGTPESDIKIIGQGFLDQSERLDEIAAEAGCEVTEGIADDNSLEELRVMTKSCPLAKRSSSALVIPNISCDSVVQEMTVSLEMRNPEYAYELKDLYKKILKVALPLITRYQYAQELNKVSWNIRNGEVSFFPRELALMIGTYTEIFPSPQQILSQLRVLEEYTANTVQMRLKQIHDYFTSDFYTFCVNNGREYPYSREILQRWQNAGFTYQSREPLSALMKCEECPELNFSFNLISSNYLWRTDPQYLHRTGCRRFKDIATASIPDYITQSKEFLFHTVMCLDVEARRTAGVSEEQYMGHSSAAIRDPRMSAWMISELEKRKKLSPASGWKDLFAHIAFLEGSWSDAQEYQKNPRAWVEAENKRLAQAGYKFRYPESVD